MTQQPYYPQQPPPQQYPPQYPQAPQQPAPAYAPPMQPQYAPPPYPAQQPGYPPQQGYGQPPQQAPLAQGNLDDFYSQPSAGSGPGIAWHDGTPQKNPRPLGTTWVGVVVRDVSNADVQQQTSPQGVPAFFRDGRPKFQMKVPLKQVAVFADPGLQQRLALPADMPEGEATWYVRGQSRDELTRAMAEAGCQGAPVTRAMVTVTLVNRRPNGGGMQPSNIVSIRYVAPDGQGAAQPPATPQAAPVQEQAPPAAQQWQGEPHPPPAQAPVQQPQQPAYAVPAGPPQPVAQQPQYQVPQVQQQQAPPPQPVQQQGQPPQFDAEQAALFARITQGQQPVQQGQPAA